MNLNGNITLDPSKDKIFVCQLARLCCSLQETGFNIHTREDFYACNLENSYEIA